MPLDCGPKVGNKVDRVLVYFGQSDSRADKLGDNDRSEIVESRALRDHS